MTLLTAKNDHTKQQQMRCVVASYTLLSKHYSFYLVAGVYSTVSIQAEFKPKPKPNTQTSKHHTIDS